MGIVLLCLILGLAIAIERIIYLNLSEKNVSVLKGKSIIVFKRNTPKETVTGKGQRLSKLRKEKIKKPFITKGNKEKIKDRTIRDIWKLFE